MGLWELELFFFLLYLYKIVKASHLVIRSKFSKFMENILQKKKQL